jgi:hypothetical protein
MHIALIFKEQTRVDGLRKKEKGLSQLHYSMQHIEGYDLLCYKEQIYIPQRLRQNQKVLSWYHEYLLHPGVIVVVVAVAVAISSFLVMHGMDNRLLGCCCCCCF